jgi:hypothetical protein
MIKKISDNYLKVVEWSEEDQCYVGTAPGLLFGGVHGKDEEKVFKELCVVVEEKPLPLFVKKANPCLLKPLTKIIQARLP